MTTATSTIRNRGEQEVFTALLQVTTAPGTAMALTTSGTLKKNDVAKHPVEILVVPEDSKAGDGIDTSITSGNLVEYIVPEPGTVLNVPTASGNAATAAIPMTVNATGAWVDATAPGDIRELNASGLATSATIVMADVASGAGLVSGINQNLANIAASINALHAMLSVKAVSTSARGTDGYAAVRIV
jgi:hypothetical protein